MLCQYCGSTNPDGLERCQRCGNRLLVVSGAPDEAVESISDEALIEAQEEFEEHLIERISTLEDSVRQLSEAVAATAAHVAQLEHNLTVAHAGVQSLGTLLEAQGIVSRIEVVDGWERAADHELRTRDLSRRFKDRAGRILSLAVHQGDATPEFRRKLRALELAVLSPDPSAADELLMDLARLAPSNDELWGFIGEIAFEGGDLEVARIAYSRVHEMRGPHFESLVYLGAIAADVGDVEAATEYLEAARRLAPDSFLPLFILGAMAATLGDHQLASELLEQALEREETPQALYLLGTCHLHLGRTGRAIQALRRSVELRPESEEALYQLGVAYLRRGWSRLALETFQQVLQLDPQRLQYQETVRLLRLEAPHNLAPDVARTVDRAESALEQARPDRALELFLSAERAAPGQPALQATVALLASSLGRTRVAVASAHRLLRTGAGESPYVGAAVVALLESLRQAGRPRVVRRIAARLVSEGRDSLARGLAAYELAMVELELGDDLERAREVAREALETLPKELRHYPLSALGAIALRRGRFREATQYLEQAVESGSLDSMMRQLAVARLAAGDAAGAAAALESSIPDPAGGIDQEMLDHVRRLGALLQDASPPSKVLRQGVRPS